MDVINLIIHFMVIVIIVVITNTVYCFLLFCAVALDCLHFAVGGWPQPPEDKMTSKTCHENELIIQKQDDILNVQSQLQ